MATKSSEGSKIRSHFLCLLSLLWPIGLGQLAFAATPHTEVSITGENFFLNGHPTYAGRTWDGGSIEGRLMNSRMVQGIFDDLNPETRARWAYPDTGKWDAER